MTVYIALLALGIGLLPVALDKWRAAQRQGMRPQRVRRPR